MPRSITAAEARAFALAMHLSSPWTHWTGIPIAVMAGSVFMLAPKLFGWSTWTVVLSFPAIALLMEGAALLRSRKRYAQLVAVGLHCPRCQKPLFAPGLWGRRADEEVRTVASGYCPRCFERCFPDEI